MRLDRLLNGIELEQRPADGRRVEVTSIVDDSRDVTAGSLFCCVIGSTVDGHDRAEEAVANGAVALVVSRPLPLDVPQVLVSDVRASLAPLGAAFYDHPDRHLRLCGITGTNGKTTTTHLLAAILTAARWRVATLGTLTGQYTSPPALQLQAKLAEFRKEHNAVVMEVSSHALVQHRVDALRFRVGIFTNLTQDHLDYHGTMEAYFDAKALLFDSGRCDKAVINVDDPYGRRLRDRIAASATPFGLADAENLVLGPVGSSFEWGGKHVELPLIGEFNVYNALAAATAARELGVNEAVIAEALTNVTPVPGRVESIRAGQPFTVLVDFAHTPDGLEKVLRIAADAARKSSGRMCVVFGCGGDRDKGKRPQMGRIAQGHADRVIVTSDNSRSEEPAAIVRDILSGMQDPQAAEVELDRRSAIRSALEWAERGDVVVIAGRGHEKTLDSGGVKVAFDDREVARELLANAFKGTSPA